MELITVTKAARELGCSERWLREAEEEGRIPKARRNLNGWRVYTPEDIAKLQELLGVCPSNSFGRLWQV